MTDCVGRGSHSDVLLQQSHKGGLRACVCVCVFILLQECANDCCHASNCTLKQDAECAHGVCCKGCKVSDCHHTISVSLLPYCPFTSPIPHPESSVSISYSRTLALLHTHKHTFVIHCLPNNTFVFSPLHSCLDLSSSVMLISQSATKRIQYKTDKCAYENSHVP